MARAYSRILVTGVEGFVGHHLVASLSKRFPEARLIGTHYKDSKPSPGNIKLDIRDAQAIDRAIGEFAPDGVVHLAAISQAQEAQQAVRATFDVNLGGTMNIAEAMRLHVPQARLLFVSTAEVYGGNERAAIDPMNAYAASKAAAELFIAQMARHGLRAIRLRPFNHIGPGQSNRFAVASFVAQIVNIESGRQEPVLSVGNLDAKRDFLDVRDVASAYLKAMVAANLDEGAVLDIASGEARRIGDILETLLKRAKVAIGVMLDPARLRAVDIPIAVGDSGLARDLLAWAPKIPSSRLWPT
jgi:GDP-4-dehydro-6-deoxy-D-mannose reductase